MTQIDPDGQEIPGGRQVYRAPVAGQDLVLSIDEPLQYDDRAGPGPGHRGREGRDRVSPC